MPIRGRRAYRWLAAALILGALTALLVGTGRPTRAHSGRGSGLPRQLTFQRARFLFDRFVTLDQTRLVRVGQRRSATVFAPTAGAPYPRLYLLSGRGRAGALARYLPEEPGNPATTPCPAEEIDYGYLPIGDRSYAFAGFEPDLTTADFKPVGNSDNLPIYAEKSGAEPYPELFIPAARGLQRFVLLDDEGVPPQLASPLPFGNAMFTFNQDVTDQLDRAGLVRIGCGGPFALLSTADQTRAPYNRLYALVGGHLLDFEALTLGTPAAPGTPTAVVTIAPSVPSATSPAGTAPIPPPPLTPPPTPSRTPPVGGLMPTATERRP